jgi:prevent-host-death family protein
MPSILNRSEKEELVSISDAKKMWHELLRRVEQQGHTALLMRHSKPAAVLVPVEEYESLLQQSEDLDDFALSTARMLTAGAKRYSLDDVLTQFGYSREELLAEKD